MANGEGQVVENKVNNNDNLIPEMKRFNCKFCDLAFSTGQALGGHQNRHRAERTALSLASHPPTTTNPIKHPSHDPISPFLPMQPPSSLHHSFNPPHHLHPASTSGQPPKCVVHHARQSWCHGDHGVGGGSGDDNTMRLRLGGVDQAMRPHEVNFQALLRGVNYYEEEGKKKDEEELDLSLHL